MKAVVEKRIQEIEAAIQGAVQNHSTLLGHLNEAKWLLQSIFNAECATNPGLGVVAGAIETAAPAVEAAIPAVEAAAHAVEGAVEGKSETAS